MIELKKITKYFKNANTLMPAIENVSLSIKANELTGIIGKSGAGKSTLLRCMNLLEKPDQGEVWINNQCLSKLNQTELRHARRQVGMIFQHFNLLSTQNVFENIALPLKFENTPEKDIKHKVNELIQLVGLQEQVNRYPSQLSGGQKQRVAIDRALANDPSVLLCDEITSALDPETTDVILDLLKHIQQKRQIAIAFITHDMNVINKVADRVIVLEQGKVVEEKNILDFFKKPTSKVGQQLVDSCMSTPIPKELSKKLLSKPGVNQLAFFRVQFLGHPTMEPIIFQLTQQHQIEINIYQARLDYIQQETIGTLLISIKGNLDEIEMALQFFNKKHCRTTLLGYQ